MEEQARTATACELLWRGGSGRLLAPASEDADTPWLRDVRNRLAGASYGATSCEHVWAEAQEEHHDGKEEEEAGSAQVTHHTPVELCYVKVCVNTLS